jgi:hypothetical protein
LNVVRFKRNGVRLWRVTWGGGYLGRTMPDVWPKLGERHRLSEREARYRSACYAVNRVAHGSDAKGFWFLIEGKAEVAITIAKVALRGVMPMHTWAIDAISNGWSAPKSWTPDKP